MKGFRHTAALFGALLGILPLSGQVIADFETWAAHPPLYAGAAVGVRENPDKSGINPSDSVGYYLKEAGNWHFVVLDFPGGVNIRYNNLLTFKLRTSIQGRIFAKFYNGSEVVIEAWCPNWNFQPSPNTWTECSMDLTAAQGKTFTQLHLAAIVDNEAEGEVWFDDVKLSNPAAGDGTPIAQFVVSPAKPETGSEVLFDATGAYDYDGDIVSYDWDFGDGNTGTGLSCTHVYTVDSLYHPLLTITDNDGKSATASSELFIVPADGSPSVPVLRTLSPETNNKIEAVFGLKGDYANVFDPDEVMVDAEIGYPDGSALTVPCFWYEAAECVNNNWQLSGEAGKWMLRFMSEQAGTHTLKLTLRDANGTLVSRTARVEVQQGEGKGIVRRDPYNRQYYRHSTGEVYYPLGINIGWNSTTNYTTIINNLSAAKASIFRYWHAAFNRQALEWSDNYFYDGLGNYSQPAAAMTDSLLDLCAVKDMCMQLVIFQHGMFSENVDSNWDTNPYNIVNGGFVDKAEKFFYDEQCRHHARKLLRYLAARYAYSPNLFAWEFFNEVQFTGYYQQTTAQWWPGVVSWHGEMSRYLESLDPWDHLQTTSAATNQLAAFDTIPSLDNLQYHIYEVGTTLLQSQASLDNSFKTSLKHASVINGEYGTTSSADMPADLQRNAIWCSIMTQVPRYMWVWDHYTDPAWANLFKGPAQYMEGEEFAKLKNLVTANPVPSHATLALKAYGMQSDTSFWGYLYDPANSTNISGAKFTVTGMPAANYSIRYYYPLTGLETAEDSIPVAQGTHSFTVPLFSKAVAWKITYHSMYALPVARAGNDTLVALGSTVQMNGSASTTPYSGPLSYLWELESKPEASAVSIADPTLEAFAFTPDAGGTYTLKLVVSDNGYSSEPAYRTITVSAPPVANAGPDSTVYVWIGTFTADGSASYDPEGDPITYSWVLDEAPAGSQGILMAADRNKAQLTIDAEGAYVLILTVRDALSASQPDTLVVTAKGEDEPEGMVPSVTDDLLVWPNPAKDELMVRLHADDLIIKIELFTLGGRKVMEQDGGGKRECLLRLDQSGQTDSLLLLRITGTGKVWSQLVRMSR
ncbi:MAG: PKD domain-containing protein [Bacteroidota bacterium]